MQIQWFPGHMHKAQKEIREVLSGIDVIIEILDARIPYSSQNPLLAQIRGDKPCIKLLHKCDLADSNGTTVWQEHLAQDYTRVLISGSQTMSVVKHVPALCRELTPVIRDTRPVHALVVGIPNVGKSTIINFLAGRKIARTGNEPAITKAQQRVDIGDGVVLRDTPGVLWPNLENRNSGYRLAATGAIKDTAIDSADVAMFAAEFMRKEYPVSVKSHYDLKSDNVFEPDRSVAELLDEIGTRRGCIGKGGIVDFDRVARIFLSDLRSGAFGPITLETPQMMALEIQIVEKERIKKETLKKEKTELRKKNRKSALKNKK